MDTQEIIHRIQELKTANNAVILAHNYVRGEVQDIADFVGDSLALSIQAKKVQAPVIVFCGVRFMAETAKILSPDSEVLLPAPDAGCPMADMADPKEVMKYRQDHPETVFVAYVNTTAAVKALVDICCTSANADKVLRTIPADREVLFLPDQNLGANTAAKLGRKLALWPGFCPTHNRIHPDEVRRIKAQYPEAKLIVHPECLPAVVELADAALSTGGMVKYVKESDAKEFIIGTENGILHQLALQNPDKRLIPLEPLPTCPNMKKVTLENLLHALETHETKVEMPKELMDRARLPIERMLEIA
ncbi:MAG: quinolinate synthase NadA [Victivallales bacterium]|nr:quinolinate synthase NadA [Victivallales bacterium]